MLFAVILSACSFNNWLSQLKVYDAWSHGIYGDGVTIGVIDTGANVTTLKEVLGDKINVKVVNISYLSHKNDCFKLITIDGKRYCVLANETMPWGYRLRTAPVTPTDDLGHGTAVTSIILSIAPHSQVIVVNAALTVFDVNAKGKVINEKVVIDPKSLIEGFEYLYNEGVDVINLSLGVPFEDVESVSNILSSINEMNVSNITIVASVGNEGIPIPSPFALENDVIAVGTLNGETVANFSNTGIGLDFVTPGTSLCLPVPSDSILASLYGFRGHDAVKWVYLSGTSFSAAMVSGLAALWIEATGAKGSSEVRCVMRYRTVDLGKKGWDPQTGYGMPLAPDGYYEPCKTVKYPLFLVLPPAYYRIFSKFRRSLKRNRG